MAIPGLSTTLRPISHTVRRACKKLEVHLEGLFIRYEALCPQCYMTSPIPEYPFTSPLPLWCVDGRRGFSDLHAMLNEYQFPLSDLVKRVFLLVARVLKGRYTTYNVPWV